MIDFSGQYANADIIEDDRILSCGNIRREIEKRYGISKENSNVTMDDKPASMKYVTKLLNIPVNSNSLDQRIVSAKNLKTILNSSFLYKRIQYLGTDGQNYIVTNYIPSSETKIESRFEVEAIYPTTDQTKHEQPLYGASTTYKQNAFEFWAQGYGFTCYDGNNYQMNTGVTANKIMLIIQDKNVLNVDNKITTFTYNTFTCPTSLCIFGTNRSAHGISSYHYDDHICRLYSFKISENDVLLHDYVPVVRLVDNTAGLFDTVENVFYENSGSRTFIAGPIVSDSIPEDWKELEYIEFKGKQYIDVGVIPNQDTHIEIEAAFSEVSSYPYALFGSRIGLYNNSIGGWIYPTYIRMDWASENHKFDISSLTAKHSIAINKNVGTVDSISYNFSYTAVTPNRTLLIGAVYKDGKLDIDSRMFHGKIYSFKMYNNDILVRNCIPVKRNDGSIGFYDLVDNIFYGNLGTGSFTAGPEI